MLKTDIRASQSRLLLVVLQ